MAGDWIFGWLGGFDKVRFFLLVGIKRGGLTAEPRKYFGSGGNENLVSRERKTPTT
jgi:hypothetical protein